VLLLGYSEKAGGAEKGQQMLRNLSFLKGLSTFPATCPCLVGFGIWELGSDRRTEGIKRIGTEPDLNIEKAGREGTKVEPSVKWNTE